MNIHIENQRLIKKNNKCIKTMIDLYNEKVELQDENKQLKKEIVHLKECNLRYRNHNELLESIIGI